MHDAYCVLFFCWILLQCHQWILVCIINIIIIILIISIFIVILLLLLLLLYHYSYCTWFGSQMRIVSSILVIKSVLHTVLFTQPIMFYISPDLLILFYFILVNGWLLHALYESTDYEQQLISKHTHIVLKKWLKIEEDWQKTEDPYCSKCSTVVHSHLSLSVTHAHTQTHQQYSMCAMLSYTSMCTYCMYTHTHGHCFCFTSLYELYIIHLMWVVLP